MNTMNTIKERRSVRQFDEKQVEKDTIVEIIETAKYSPTWGHSQIVRYTVLENKEIIERISKEAMCDFAHNMNIVKNAPSLLIISTINGKSGTFEGGKRQGAEWEMFDAGAAAQTFALAAHTKGVGSVVLGIFDMEKVAEIIDLPSDQSVATVMPFGYTLKESKTPPRKSLEDLVSFL